MVRIRPEKEEILPRASRTFTDRETPKQAFMDALGGKSPDDHKILMFYGNGGFGKSRLIEHLSQQCGHSPWAVLDFRNPTYRNKTDALLALRNRLRKFGKKTNVTKRLYSFMAFDLAYALWKRKARPSDPITESQPWGLEESGIVGDLLATLKDIPVAGIVPKVLVLAVKGHAAIRNFVGENRIQIHRWEEMEPYKIEQELPKLWAEDARKFFQSIAPGHTPVLFLDTYEALWETHSKGTFHSVDSWVRDLVTALHEPLWVICGRENLRWAEKRPEWKEAIESHRLGGLSKTDCESFLRSCGIDDGEVIAAITGPGGKAPLYLDVAVDTWYQIKRLDRIPVSEDFHQATGRTSFRQNLDEVLNRFLMYLTPVQQRIVKLLAVPRFWDDVLLAKLLKKFASRYTVEDFEEELGQYVLFERDEKTSPPRWTMHESVRESFLPELPEKRKDEVEKFLFGHYDALFKGIEPKNLREEHLIALEEAFLHGKSFMDLEGFLEWFIDRKATFYTANRWFQRQIDMLLDLMSWEESELGAEHVDLAGTLFSLGQLYEEIDEMENARKCLERALKIYDKTVDPIQGVARIGEHTSIDYEDKGLGGYIESATQALNAMGIMYARIGEYDKAKEYFSKYFRIVEVREGPNTEYMASALGTMGAFHCDSGDHVSAKKYLEKSIDIYNRMPGKKRFGMAGPLDSMGCVLKEFGEYKKARVCFERSLKMKRGDTSQDGLSIAGTLNNFAHLYEVIGDYDKAQANYEESLKIKKDLLKPNHTDILLTLENLGRLHNTNGNYKKAKEYYLQSLAIRKEIGDSEPEVVKLLISLGVLCDYCGQYKEGEGYYLEALEIAKRENSLVERGAIVKSLNGLGYLYVLDGRPGDALPLLNEAVEMEINLDVGICQHANTKDSLASALRDLGKFAEAEDIYKESLRIWEKELGEENEDQLETLVNMALLYRKMDRPDQADQYVPRALFLHKKLLGPSHPRTIRARDRLTVT